MEINAFSQIPDLQPGYEYTPQNVEAIGKLEVLKNQHTQSLLDEASKALAPFDAIKAADSYYDPQTKRTKVVGDYTAIQKMKGQYSQTIVDAITNFRSGKMQPYEFAKTIRDIKRNVDNIKSNPFVRNAEDSYNTYASAIDNWNKNVAGKISGNDPVGIDFTKQVFGYNGAGSGKMGNPVIFNEVNKDEQLNNMYKGMESQLDTDIQKVNGVSKQRYGDKDWLVVRQQYLETKGKDRVEQIFDAGFLNSPLAAQASRIAQFQVQEAIANGTRLLDRKGNEIVYNDQMTDSEKQAAITSAINEKYWLQKSALRSEAVSKFVGSTLKNSLSVQSFPEDDADKNAGGFGGLMNGVFNPNSGKSSNFEIGPGGGIISTNPQETFGQAFGRAYDRYKELGKLMGQDQSWLGRLQVTAQAVRAGMTEGIVNSFSDARGQLQGDDLKLYNNTRRIVERENPELFSQSKSTAGRAEGTDPALEANKKLEQLTFERIKQTDDQISLQFQLPTSKEESFFRQNKQPVLTNAVIIDPLTGEKFVGTEFLRKRLEIGTGDKDYNKKVEEITFDTKLSPKNPYTPYGLVYSYRGVPFIVDFSYNASQAQTGLFDIGQVDFGDNTEINRADSDGGYTTLTLAKNQKTGSIEATGAIKHYPDGTSKTLDASKIVLSTGNKK